MCYTFFASAFVKIMYLCMPVYVCVYSAYIYIYIYGHTPLHDPHEPAFQLLLRSLTSQDA